MSCKKKIKNKNACCTVKFWVAVIKVTARFRIAVHVCLDGVPLKFGVSCCQMWYSELRAKLSSLESAVVKCGIGSYEPNSQAKIGLLSSRSESQCILIQSKYDCFYDIFQTTASFTTRPSFPVHNPKCHMKRLECCGEGHIEG